jgi:precorrin-3B synthase
VVTPWRTVVLADPVLPVERLAAAGLVVDPEAAGVSACAGRPGCAKSLADVRADAREALAAGRVPAGRRVHVVGCARRCGAPRGPHTRRSPSRAAGTSSTASGTTGLVLQ